jgi:hypothetical protein
MAKDGGHINSPFSRTKKHNDVCLDKESQRRKEETMKGWEMEKEEWEWEMGNERWGVGGKRD